MALASKHRLDVEKAVEVLLYVTKSVPNMYNALKVLYFADKAHLAKYGRLIYGDSYVAMRHGPVPSAAYDILKGARGDGICPAGVSPADLFSIDTGHCITPRRDANLELLSESDLECLDGAIEEYGCLTFAGLQKRSHSDRAFQSSDENDFMSLEDIAASLPDGHLLLDYMKNG